MYKKSSPKSGADKGYKGKSDRPAANFDKKPFKRKDDGQGGEKPFRKREDAGGDKPFRDRKPASDRPSSREDKPFRKREDAGGDKPFRDRKPRFDSDSADSREDKPFRKRENGGGDKPFRDRKSASDRPSSREDKPFRKREDGDKPFRERKFDGDRTSSREDKPFRKREDGDKPFNKDRKPRFDSDKRGGDREDKPFRKREDGDKPFNKDRKPRFDSDKRGGDREDKPFRKREDGDKPFARREQSVTFRKELKDEKPQYKKGDMATRKPFAGMPERKKSKEDFRREVRTSEKDDFKKAVKDNDKEYFGDDDDWEVEGDKRPKVASAATYPMPLNKYIAHSGECSRRDGAELVKQGKVKVNDELIIDPGHKINEGDKVTLSGKKLTPQKGLVYVLLNKPKGFITTNEDDRGRKTVMDLVANADASRLFPVGRLDRATTGLLLLTNDGDLTQKLAHPSFDVKKVYQVTLDKPLTKTDFEKIMHGLELEDGKAEVDELAYLEVKNELGVEIHSGKNRIVRRIFESLGYVVEKLDRMMYAGLTKKNLPRGKWRYLNEKEIILLKHFKS